jgi:hypothetical protein
LTKGPRASITRVIIDRDIVDRRSSASALP